MKIGLNKYLRLARQNEANKKLEEGERVTVGEVAYAVGFKTPHYFSNTFNKMYGKEPSE